MGLQTSWRKFLALFRRGRIERELAEEMETHRRMLEQAGDGSAAHRMGNVALAREQSHDVWGFHRLEAMYRDLRYALRGFLRDPAFTITAIISLALGIGANTAIFSAVSAIFLRPLPVKDPASLVIVSAIDRNGEERWLRLSHARQIEFSGAFSDVIGLSDDGLSLQYGDRAERILGEGVTPNFFSALGVPTILGEGFSESVRRGKWAPEAVLSYSFWKSRFAGDPSVVGKVIRLNTYPFTIVGVSAPSFYSLHQGRDQELRIPILPPGRQLRELELLDPKRHFALIARIASGVSRVKAQTIAEGQFREFVRTLSIQEQSRYRKLQILSGDHGWQDLRDEFKTPLTILFPLVFLVLLIACANVANMSLARAETRRRELAVRSSLGAGRGRLVQQIVIESLLLACCAGLAGLIAAHYAAQALPYFLPQGHIHLVLDMRPDAASIAFTVCLSLAAGLLFGITTAYQSTRGNLISGLKSGVSGASGTVLRKFLLAGQIAFSLALLMIAGLFIRTVFNLRPKTDFIGPERILVFTMKPQKEIYKPEQIRTLTAEFVRRVAELPGVEAVSLAENGPFASRDNSGDLQVHGGHLVQASADWVFPGFFSTLGLRVLDGRDFTPSDRLGSDSVIVINQRLAEALFPRQNAVGRIVEMPSPDGLWSFRVIGVVANSHYYDARREYPAAFYAYQDVAPYMPTLHVRVKADNARAFIPVILREFDAIDKGFPVFNIRTLQDRMDDALSRERMVAALATVFGILSLALAAVGLYGVFAYAVTQRTREIGIRMALGSEVSRVIWLLIREALLLAGAGAFVGLGVAVGGGYLLSKQLYGVRPMDPVTLAASGGIMLVIAILGVSIPTFRASRIDPMVALRTD